MKESKPVSLGLLILRIGLGVIVLYFGLKKVMPIWGSEGFYASMDYLTKSTGAPPWLAMSAILAETAGVLGVMIGLLTRLAAFGILGTMAVAVYTKVSVANLYDAASMQEVFFPAAVGLLALSLVVMGAGQLSIDAKIAGGMDARIGKKKQAS